MFLIFFDGINFDFEGMEFVFEQQVLFRVDSLFDLRPHGLVPGGGERGQNLEHLKKFFLLLIFLNVIVSLNIRYYLGMTFCKF